MRFPRTSFQVALFVATSALIGASFPGRLVAAGAACPMYLIKYCVVEKDGARHAVWTNLCLAKRESRRVLHKGACSLQRHR